jgi:hypothetical protein
LEQEAAAINTQFQPAVPAIIDNCQSAELLIRKGIKSIFLVSFGAAILISLFFGHFKSNNLVTAR